MKENSGLQIPNTSRDGLLNAKAKQYEHPDFIADDPIALPHQFEKLQDIEIIAFWVSILAWGQRQTIINKGLELIDLMEGRPHHFILHHTSSQVDRFLEFKHRTFNATDSMYFLRFLQDYYRKHESLETAFSKHMTPDLPTIEDALVGFQNTFFSLPDAPRRTQKHIATPARKSTCKRLNMFLRWMVRPSTRGVDFGLWNEIRSDQLCPPLDVHVERIARKMGLLKRKTRDWKAVLELRDQLVKLDPADPVKYDFALFGIGRYEGEKNTDAHIA
ncbi:MAG: TIGR02757 family protein [Bacteroidetes bacterium]|jgi:uncharacterized protein (TIGR02757 family)|nr:TIGR02757 family protein [Bacteroidota bacterium]